MNSLEQTESFMRAAGQTIPDVPTQPSESVLLLRLKLEFEELREKAQGFGLDFTFCQMVVNQCLNTHAHHVLQQDGYMGEDSDDSLYIKAEDTGIYNPVAVLDACCDQRVVQDGTVLACGLASVFPTALDEVHRSNMSKFPADMDEAAQTSVHYKEQGIETEWGAQGGLWPVKRKSDGKILKSINYSPANLAPLLA